MYLAQGTPDRPHERDTNHAQRREETLGSYTLVTSCRSPPPARELPLSMLIKEEFQEKLEKKKLNQTSGSEGL